MSTPQAWKQLLSVLSKESNFTISQNILDLSLNDIGLLISLGEKSLQCLERTNLDETLKLQLDAKDDSMQKAIETMMTKNDERFAVIQAENEQLLARCQTLEKYSAEQKEFMKVQVRGEVEEEVEIRCKETYNIIVKSLQDQIKTIQEACDDAKQDRAHTQAKYDALNEKLPHMNMVAMGNIGEEFVVDLTRQAFNYECDVISKSQDPHCMDIRINTPSGFNANLEIKSADPVQTVRDVHKFHRDLQELIARSEINASALISLKAPIPNYKSGTLCFKTNSVGMKIPILYIHVTSPEILKHSLNLLKEVQQLCRMEHEARGCEAMPLEIKKYHEEKNIFKKIVPELFHENTEEEEQLLMQLDHLKRVKEISENRLAKLQIARQLKANLQDNVSWLFDNPTVQSTKLDKAIAIWETYKENNKKDPANLAAFGTDEPFIKNIGYAKLKEAVREKRKREKVIVDEPPAKK